MEKTTSAKKPRPHPTSFQLSPEAVKILEYYKKEHGQPHVYTVERALKLLGIK